MYPIIFIKLIFEAKIILGQTIPKRGLGPLPWPPLCVHSESVYVDGAKYRQYRISTASAYEFCITLFSNKCYYTLKILFHVFLRTAPLYESKNIIGVTQHRRRSTNEIALLRCFHDNGEGGRWKLRYLWECNIYGTCESTCCDGWIDIPPTATWLGYIGMVLSIRESVAVITKSTFGNDDVEGLMPYGSINDR